MVAIQQISCQRRGVCRPSHKLGEIRPLSDPKPATHSQQHRNFPTWPSVAPSHGQHVQETAKKEKFR
jgi:hypothetical protein